MASSLRRGVWLILGALLAFAPAARAATYDEDAARAHFLAGQAYYDQKAFADALREFRAAYELAKRPALLYNVARAEEQLGHPHAAADALASYLAAEPSATDRAAVQHHIDELRAMPEAAATSVPSPSPGAAPPRPTPSASPTSAALAPSPAAGPAPPRHRTRIATWLVGGAGVLLLGGALTAGLIADNRYRELSARCSGSDCSAVTGGAELAASGRSAATAADVLLAVGATAVVAGVVLFFVEGRAGKAAPLRASRAGMAWSF